MADFILKFRELSTQISRMCAPVCKSTNSGWIFSLPISLQQLFSIVLWVSAVLTGIRWHLQVVFICISLTARDNNEQVVISLTHFNPFLWKLCTDPKPIFDGSFVGIFVVIVCLSDSLCRVLNVLWTLIFHQMSSWQRVYQSKCLNLSVLQLMTQWRKCGPYTLWITVQRWRIVEPFTSQVDGYRQKRSYWVKELTQRYTRHMIPFIWVFSTQIQMWVYNLEELQKAGE